MRKVSRATGNTQAKTLAPTKDRDNGSRATGNPQKYAETPQQYAEIPKQKHPKQYAETPYQKPQAKTPQAKTLAPTKDRDNGSRAQLAPTED